MIIAGVMVVRNEVDVLATNIAHHRSIGVDRFWVVDNGSTDGTTELLRSMARQHEWLNWTSEPGAFRQGEFASHMAREAHRSGAEWILPIDADEFWWTRHRSLDEVLANGTAGAYLCEMETFVQTRQAVHDHPGSLTTMTYRAAARGTSENAQMLVETGRIGFAEMAYPPKLAMRASHSLTIEKGNHAASGFVGPLRRSSDIVVLHAAVRSRARLDLLAEHGRRVAAVDPDPETGWHLRRWARMDAEGTLETDWLRNSQVNGELDIGGEKRRLLRDDRLRNVAAQASP